MKHKSFVLLFATVCLLVSGIVFAQTGATTTISQTAKQKSIDRCATIRGNVEKRLNNFENKKTRDVAKYNRVKTRIETLVNKLESENYDVSAIRAGLVNLNDKIEKFNNDYGMYIEDLRETKEFTCGRSSGEFQAKLANARLQLKVVHDDAVDIQTFWAKTIKPAILDLNPDAAAGSNTVEGSN